MSESDVTDGAKHVTYYQSLVRYRNATQEWIETIKSKCGYEANKRIEELVGVRTRALTKAHVQSYKWKNQDGEEEDEGEKGEKESKKKDKTQVQTKYSDVSDQTRELQAAVKKAVSSDWDIQDDGVDQVRNESQCLYDTEMGKRRLSTNILRAWETTRPIARKMK